MEVASFTHRPALPQKKEDIGMNWIRGSVGPKAGLNNLGKRKMSCFYRKPYSDPSEFQSAALSLHYFKSTVFSFFWRNSPHWARVSSFTRFLDHTQRHITVGRTPLQEWSVRRTDLYLTTHNTHNRQTSISPVGFEPTISAGERPQTHALDRAATGTGTLPSDSRKFCVVIITATASLVSPSKSNRLVLDYQ